MKHKPKALITGAGGFIGSLMLRHPKIMALYELQGIDRNINFEVAEYIDRFGLGEFDVVFHLAAQTSVFNTNCSDVINDNITVFKRVVDACAKDGVRLVYASSSTAEECNTTSIYGLTKRFGERYAQIYAGDIATGVRFHNVYSANPRHGTLLWHLLEKPQVTLYNNGANVRHFTYIEDIIQGLLKAVDMKEPLVNIANPQENSVAEFARIVSQYNGVEIIHTDHCRKDDRSEQWVNPSIPTIELSYTPIEKGIPLCIRKFND